MALSPRNPPVGHNCPWLPLLILLFTCSGCQPPKAPEGHGLLPESPADQTISAAAAPSRPFDQPLGKGALGRTVFQTPGPSKTEITVSDVVVGPHEEGSLPTATGPVLIDVRSGSGSVAADGKTLDLSSERLISVSAGAAITLKNSGDAPLVLRLYTVEGK
jgi:hypothetical protein